MIDNIYIQDAPLHKCFSDKHFSCSELQIQSQINIFFFFPDNLVDRIAI